MAKKYENMDKECCGGDCCQDEGQGKFAWLGKWHRFGLFGFVITLAAVLILVGIVRGILRDQVQFDQRNSFTVSGKGKVFAKPDVAVLSLGVKTERQKTASEAVAQNTKKMNEVMASLKKSGIDEKDIKTTAYNLNPVYDYSKPINGGELQGYELMQNVDVKIHDLSKVGDIIKVATDAGANQIGNINFTIDDLEVVKAQARAEAIKIAQAKAKTMAKSADFRIGDIMSIYENEQPYPPIMYGDKAVGLGLGGSSEVAAPVPSPDIQVGTNEITVEVNITYQIKD